MKSDFRELEVWRKAREIRRQVFLLVRKFPDEERYRLSDQMIRASRSITANTAEGYGRYHFGDNMRFCRQSRGSVYELMDHAEVALECQYIGETEGAELRRNIEEVLALLNGYIKYLDNRRVPPSAQPLNHSTNQQLNQEQSPEEL